MHSGTLGYVWGTVAGIVLVGRMVSAFGGPDMRWREAHDNRSLNWVT